MLDRGITRKKEDNIVIRDYTPYRRTLAWIGFYAVFAFSASAIVGLLWLFNHNTPIQAERTEAFYQQTK